VSSAFAITQGIGFLFAAAATGVGGVVQRNLGQKAATGVVAGILLFLTILLLGVLIRWSEVQIIPDSKRTDMERWENARRRSISMAMDADQHGNGEQYQMRQLQVDEEEEAWRPVIIGNPSGTMRRMSVLELGHLTRWSEIRKKNKLIDEMGLEGRHPNLVTLGSVKGHLKEVSEEVIRSGSLGRGAGRRRRAEHRPIELRDEGLVSPEGASTLNHQPNSY
jgi:hypothetical protein